MIQAPSDTFASTLGHSTKPVSAIAPNLLAGTASFPALLGAFQAEFDVSLPAMPVQAGGSISEMQPDIENGLETTPEGILAAPIALSPFERPTGKDFPPNASALAGLPILTSQDAGLRGSATLLQKPMEPSSGALMLSPAGAAETRQLSAKEVLPTVAVKWDQSGAAVEPDAPPVLKRPETVQDPEITRPDTKAAASVSEGKPTAQPSDQLAHQPAQMSERHASASAQDAAGSTIALAAGMNARSVETTSDKVAQSRLSRALLSQIPSLPGTQPAHADLTKAGNPADKTASDQSVQPRFASAQLPDEATRPRGPLSRLRNPEASERARLMATSSEQASATLSAPASTPAPSPSAPQIAALTTTATASMPPAGGEPRGELRLGQPIEAIVNQLTEAREASRSARPELTLRHHEFGAINMRIDASGSDLRATLASRDPGFVPAIQAALNERMVAAAGESSAGQSHKGSDRGNEQNTSSQSSQGQLGGSGGFSEGRYGSSPGSSQASSQPYRGQSEGDGSDGTQPDQATLNGDARQNSSGTGLFA